MKLAKAMALRIKELREAAGLSQQEVAMKAHLSLSLVAKLEQGKKADPRASTLLALAGALKVVPGRLLENLFPPLATETTSGAAAKNADTEGPAPAAKPSRKKKRKKGKHKPKAKRAAEAG